MARRSVYLGNGRCSTGFSQSHIGTTRAIYPSLPNVGAFTMICWMYVHTIRDTESNGGIFTHTVCPFGLDTPDDTSWTLFRYNSTPQFFVSSTIADSPFFASLPTLGVWIPYALSGNADVDTTATGYWIPPGDPGDGSTMVSQTITGSITTATANAGNLIIGRASTTDDFGFTEWVDASFSNMIVYNVALTSAQVKAQMISTTSAPIITGSTLWGYYRMDDASNWGKDSSGNNHNLSVFGTPIDGPSITFSGDTDPSLPTQSGIRYANYGARGVTAAGGTSIAITYPAGISAGDMIVLLVGQKPPTASPNTGTLTTPAGYTLLTSLTGTNDGNTGGYTTTIGADTGNMNAYALTRVADGSESGAGTLTLTVSGATGSVAYANVYVFTNFSKLWDVAGATGKTSASYPVVSITASTTMDIKQGDRLVGFFCNPTDVNPGQKYDPYGWFVPGITTDSAAEMEMYFESNGNDAGGFVSQTPVGYGTASGAPTFSATASGTTTNMNGPGLFIRLREIPLGPVITVQPQSAVGKPGGTVTFTVTATGTGTLHYQWQKNGSNVGTDSSSYTTPTLDYTFNGAVYTVVVTDDVASTTSNSAILTIAVAVAWRT